MNDLSKEKMAAYIYLVVLVSLIFSLSFNVQGNKISGAVVVDTLGLISDISINTIVLVLFGFFLALAFSLYIIKHAHEIREELHHLHVNRIVLIVVLLLIVSFLSFGAYNESKIGITGFAIAGSNKDITENPVEYFSNPIGTGKKAISIDGKDVQFTSRIGIGSNTGTLDLYESNGDYFIVKDNSGSAIKGTLFDGFIKFSDGNTDYRIRKDGSGELEVFVGEGFTDEVYVPVENSEKESTAVQKNNLPPLSDENNLKYYIGKKAARLTNQLTSMILSPYVDDYASEMCKEDYEASSPSSNTPSTSSFSSENNLIDLPSVQSSNCPNDLTSVAAQASKSQSGSTFTYRTSWTLNACKQDTSFTVYLGNSLQNRVSVATGFASKSSLKTGSKVTSQNVDYQFICVQTQDSSIGNNGVVCFDIP